MENDSEVCVSYFFHSAVSNNVFNEDVDEELYNLGEQEENSMTADDINYNYDKNLYDVCVEAEKTFT